MDSESEAKRLREMGLDALTERAISLYDPGSPGRQAELELQRRLIAGQGRLIAESAHASGRLLAATRVIIALTVVLVVLAVLELAGALD